MNERHCLLVVLVIVAGMSTAWAGPPLPLHTVEGNSGVFITSTAYLANPPAEGDVLGLPSLSTSGAFWGRQ